MKRLITVGLAACLATAAHAQTAQELSKSDPGYVLNYGMDYGQQRYSALAKINAENVKHLVPAWNLSYDDNRAEELQPLVYQGVLYVTTNSATIAVDAKTGKQLWKTKVEYPPETPRVVCCGIINRGAALYEGKIIRGTLDAKLVALDAKTGKQLWKSDVAEMKGGYTMTGAPQIADGVIMTGISGAEFGTRDFIDGWDPADGKHLWRTYTVPLANEKGGDTWPGIPPRPAADRPGLPAHSIRNSTPSIGVSVTPAPSTPQAARATTSTPVRCSRSIRRPAPSSGTISSRPTIPSTMTASPNHSFDDRGQGQAHQGIDRRQPQRLHLCARSNRWQIDRRQPLCEGELGFRHRHDHRSADRNRDHDQGTRRRTG